MQAGVQAIMYGVNPAEAINNIPDLFSTEQEGVGADALVRCAVFDGNLHSRSAIEFHAFAPLEALACGV